MDCQYKARPLSQPWYSCCHSLVWLVTLSWLWRKWPPAWREKFSWRLTVWDWPDWTSSPEILTASSLLLLVDCSGRLTVFTMLYQTFKHIDIQIMSFNGSFANYFLPQQNSKASGSEVMLFVQNKHIFDNDWLSETEPLASIDRSLLTSMVSVAVTYIIVLLQFRISLIQQQWDLRPGSSCFFKLNWWTFLEI